MRKIIIDTDPGMDDSLAIILALLDPSVEVLGITTVAGNYPIEVTTANARKVLDLLNRTNITVARGEATPLERPLPEDPFSHGEDGMGETWLPESDLPVSQLSAADQILKLVSENAGDVTLVCLGPLTNVARAILKDPETMKGVSEIIAIAGSFGLNQFAFSNATGATPQSEWNVFVDPEAAKIVFAEGEKLTAIGLDVATHFDVNFSEDELVALAGSDRPEARLVEKMVRFVQGRGFQSYCVLIDSMAVAAAIDPTLVETVRVRVGVETKGELTLGQTVADFRHHHAWDDLPYVNVAKSADFRRFLDLILTRLGVAE